MQASKFPLRRETNCRYQRFPGNIVTETIMVTWLFNGNNIFRQFTAACFTFTRQQIYMYEVQILFCSPTLLSETYLEALKQTQMYDANIAQLIMEPFSMKP